MIETGRFLQQRYRIDKQIGQGGMGAVYVATDERFGSTVAIKETLCMDDNFRKAIEREARLLNSLKHSALPRVSDHFEEDNGLFLVMEYIPGDDVGSMLEPGRDRFSVEQVLKWADQLLDALDYLHTQDNPVIHRDIKPQNLKITPRGDMILLDFGLAKGNPTDASHKTAAKSIFGYSRNYASLEQIQGTGTDPRSDLYSLAATLYHLLTNVGPEDALTRAMAVLSQKQDPLVPASTVNAAVPRGIAGVLQKALALNADERPGSAVEMRQMLHESENYGYLADTVTVTSRAGLPPIFGQETKLMPDETRADFVKQTDVKTEVLPTNLSEVTVVNARVAGPATPTNVIAANFTSPPTRKRRSVWAAIVALGLLLAGGLIAAGLYTVKPSLFYAAPPKESDKSLQTGSTGPGVTEANVDSASNVNAARTGSSTAEGATNEAPTKVEIIHSPATAAKTAVTAKNNKSNPGERPPSNNDDPGLQVTHGDLPGDVVVTERDRNGAMSNKVLRNGRRGPNQQTPRDYNPFPNGVDMRNLTPAQKRRLKAARRNGELPPFPNRPPPN